MNRKHKMHVYFANSFIYILFSTLFDLFFAIFCCQFILIQVSEGMKSSFADILFRLYWCIPSIILNLSYDYTEPFLRFY